MTPAEHRLIGRILGFPSCCVEQWVMDRINPPDEPSGTMRGCVTERYRTLEEVTELHARLQATGIEFIVESKGWTVEGMMVDNRKAYVPCDLCVDNPLVGTWEP